MVKNTLGPWGYIMRALLGTALVLVVGMSLYASQGEALAGCLERHSYDTCAHTLNR
jgi:hypothetical protein